MMGRIRRGAGSFPIFGDLNSVLTILVDVELLAVDLANKIFIIPDTSANGNPDH